MSKYEKPAKDESSAIVVRESIDSLKLPDAAGLDYDPPVYSLADMFARGTARLQANGSAMVSEESRKQGRCHKEFVL